MTADEDAGDRIRTALVTGGTGGMGRVIAAKLAADGFDVAVAYAGSVDLADATVKEIAGHGRRGAAFAADIADEEAAAALFDAVEDRFGHLDVVVHTAGINRPAALADLDLADFDEIHRVNVRGTFVVNQQAARRVRDGGSIVNISSSMVRVAPPGLSAYAASKAAVDVLTRILAKELRGRDITVNAVAPGPTATAAFLHSTPAEEQEQLAALPPLGRLGRPDDIAGVVSFLVGRPGDGSTARWSTPTADSPDRPPHRSRWRHACCSRQVHRRHRREQRHRQGDRAGRRRGRRERRRRLPHAPGIHSRGPGRRRTGWRPRDGVEADVSRTEDLHRVIQAAVENFGRLDVLVSNAGIETRTSLLETSEADFDKVLAVNLKSAFFGAQFAAQQFMAQGSGGLVVTISSTHEDWPMPGNIAYCVAKGGAKMLTRTAGVELGSLGIRFVNIAPGAVSTPINAVTEMDPELLRRLNGAIPLGRIGQAAEIANVVVFLASDKAGYLNATTVTVDGGLRNRAWDCDHDADPGHYDVLVIGSGPGGATTAARVAETGKRVLLLERGDVLPRERDNWDSRAVFGDTKYTADETFYDARDRPFRPELHYYVGGNSKVYGAALLRLLPADFGEVRHPDGVAPAWPLGYDDMEPYYVRAEHLFWVHGEHGEDPFGPSSRDYPYPPVRHEPRIRSCPMD